VKKAQILSFAMGVVNDSETQDENESINESSEKMNASTSQSAPDAESAVGGGSGFAATLTPMKPTELVKTTMSTFPTMTTMLPAAAAPTPSPTPTVSFGSASLAVAQQQQPPVATIPSAPATTASRIGVNTGSANMKRSAETEEEERVRKSARIQSQKELSS
jgi:hypothetical protein